MSDKQRYIATFCYSVEVEADVDDYDTAENLAYEEFEKYIKDGAHAGDFAMSDVEYL